MSGSGQAQATGWVEDAQMTLASEATYASQVEPIEEEPLDLRSSGLIRAGLAGASLFVAVIVVANLLGSVFQNPPSDIPRDIEFTSAPVDQGESEYVRLRQDWLSARALLESEEVTKASRLSVVSKSQKEIELQQKAVDQANTTLTAARRAAAEAQEDVALKAERLSDLASSNTQRALDTANLAVEQATAEAAQAQTDLQAIKAEQARVKSTVTQLRKALKAAVTAADAAKLVVTAAESARAAVANNQDVMAGADEPTLSNLENDFFAEATIRADAAEKSADAAGQAVEVAQMRLEILEDQMGDYRARFAEANQLEKEANLALSRAKEAVANHKAEVKLAEKAAEKAAMRYQTSEKRASDADAILIKRQARLDELRKTLADANDIVAVSDKTLAIVREQFAEIETDLKAAQRDHSEKAAVAIAALNVVLNEKLRTVAGAGQAELPVFDRFVVSSEQLFDTGSAQLNKGGRALLTKVVPVVQDVVKDLPRDVEWVLRVDGHTDQQPLSGNGRFKDNWELSQARALSVVKFLIEQSTLGPTQMSANGFGEHQPIAIGGSVQDNARNRRIELTLAAR
ncbi:MAG: OmpA family protein [Pseudomonadota bacterium]